MSKPVCACTTWGGCRDGRCECDCHLTSAKPPLPWLCDERYLLAAWLRDLAHVGTPTIGFHALYAEGLATNIYKPD